MDQQTIQAKPNDVLHPSNSMAISMSTLPKIEVSNIDCEKNIHYAISQNVLKTQSESGKDKPCKSLVDKYIRLLRDATVGSLYNELGTCETTSNGCNPQIAIPYNDHIRYLGTDWPIVGHTMVGLQRMDFVIEELSKIIENGILGDFIELGTWRGGVVIVARALFDVSGQGTLRHVIGFDAFDKIPKYGADAIIQYLSVPYESVVHNFKKYNLWDPDWVHLVSGMFEETVPNFAEESNLAKKICFLRIDGNFYTSYETSLYFFYERVSIGGIIFFDDIPSHVAAKNAWEDFQRDQNIVDSLNRFKEGDGSWIRKTQDVKIDMNKYRKLNRND